MEESNEVKDEIAIFPHYTIVTNDILMNNGESTTIRMQPEPLLASSHAPQIQANKHDNPYPSAPP